MIQDTALPVENYYHDNESIMSIAKFFSANISDDNIVLVEPRIIDTLITYHCCASPEILHQQQQGTLHTVICWAKEGLPATVVLPILLEFLANSKIEMQNVSFITGNLNEYDNDLIRQVGIRTFALSFFDMQTRSINYEYVCKTYEPRDFLSFNGALKPHRTYLYLLLEKYNLLNRGWVSYLKNELTENNAVSYFSDIADPETVRSMEMIAYSPSVTIDVDKSRYHDSYCIDQGLYRATDFSVITESLTDKQATFVTEKTFKAIMLQHPFLIIGSPGLLRYLRSQGYQTFNFVFDESYDNIKDEVPRIRAVVDQIKNFQPSLATLTQMKAVANHNYRVFLNTDYKTRIEHIFNNIRGAL